MSLFGELLTTVHVGDRLDVRYRTTAGIVSVTGRIQSLTDSYLSIVTADGTEYISDNEISGFRLLAGSKQAERHETPTSIPSPAVAEPEILSAPVPEAAGTPSFVNEESTASDTGPNVEGVPETPSAQDGPVESNGSDNSGSYRRKPIVDIYPPDFKIPDLAHDDRAVVVRALNRYNYALKIKDPERIGADILPLSRLAERTGSVQLEVLTASLAFVSGKPESARDHFLLAAQAGNVAAFLGLAAVYAELGRIAESYWMLGRYLAAPGTTGEKSRWLRLLEELAVGLSTTTPAEADRILETISTADMDEMQRIRFDALVDKVGSRVGRISGQTERPGAANGEAPAPLPGPEPGRISPRFATETISAPTVDVDPLASDKQRGVVGRYSPSEGYGLVSGDDNPLPIYFDSDNIDDPKLRYALETGWLGPVYFFTKMTRSRLGANRTIAYALVPVTPFSDRTGTLVSTERKKVREKPRPRRHRGSHWQFAKQLELDGDLAGAKAEYEREINEKGDHRLSAIKELAWLLNRMNQWQEAIGVLDRYRGEFSGDTRAVDNLRLNIFIKGEQYAKARQVIANLRVKADRRRDLGLIKQDIYCLIALNDLSRAERILRSAMQVYPDDSSLEELMARLATFTSDIDEIDLKGLQTLGLGISPFSSYFLETAKLTGADERSKARGYFDESDFVAVTRFFEDIRGRRPRERAEVALTLAYICWQNQDAAGDSDLTELLRRYFSIMAEASVVASSSADTIRTYVTETIALAKPEGIAIELPVLLSTYVSIQEHPSMRVRDKLGPYAQAFLADPEAWLRFRADLPYYERRCPHLRDVLRDELLAHQPMLAFDQKEADLLLQQERERQRDELGTAQRLKKIGNIGIAKLEQLEHAVRHLSQFAKFSIDKDRASEVAEAIAEIERYWDSVDYEAKESSYARAHSALHAAMQRITEAPTEIGIVHLLGAVQELSTRLEKSHTKYLDDAQPRITVHNVLEEDSYPFHSDETLTVSLNIELSVGSPPIEQVTVCIESESGIRAFDHDAPIRLMRGGSESEFRIKVKPTSVQRNDLAFDLVGRVEYECFEKPGTSELFSIPVRFASTTSFTPIYNPYESYSGGSVVDDPEMFFGRKLLLQKILGELTVGPPGQCFVLYGQKRSGKSSILSQLTRRLTLPHIVANVTLGEINASTANTSFLRLCVEELRETAKKEGFENEIHWPSRNLGDEPLAEFKRLLRDVHHKVADLLGQPIRIIYLVDEFTYMYEYITEGVVDGSFMRQWKALHESKLFSTVLVGQDSMPGFKRKFPNEFGVTHDERISYLDVKSAGQLCEKPIHLDGRTRFRGRSLDRMLSLSGRSPWFLQIMCDELVRHLNERRADLITESDINAVAKALVSGSAMLPIERFDPFISEAGESVSLAPSEVYLEILAWVADHSRSGGGVWRGDLSRLDMADLDVDMIVDDMLEREVLANDGDGRLRIHVGIFELWLQANRPPKTRSS
ncbi:hypothetical protein ACFYTQ_23735 [Nocardia sp. NPDC004068]|uniref:hypothetical protein n=1 Tax=Nocardia sp. NPDC004068 TaxID=3364303 RepID=UPI0036A2D4DC